MAGIINAQELIEILEATPANQNIMLMGKHGIGKSQILDTYFSGKGFKVVPLFLGQMSDPGDLIGLLNKNETTGKTEFLPPYWFPTDEKPIVLFLDELNRARPEILQTIMDLALNRTLAGKKLPDGSRIISAVNNGDEYQLTDLDPALVSRFNIYEFKPTVKDWLVWANKNEIDERVTSFISQYPQYLDGDGSGEVESLEKTPDRRAWERVSQIITPLENLSLVHKKMISGIIGNRATNAFFETVKTKTVITGADVMLGNFAKTQLILQKYTTPDLAVVNESIFIFIESCNYKESDVPVIANNLQKYFSFLEKNSHREAMAHFSNIFAGTEYPNTLAFIIEHTDDLYAHITEFVGALK